MKGITRINKTHLNAYEGLREIINYFNNADDLGWTYKVPTIEGLMELYAIENYELDNGGLFSESDELIEKLAQKRGVDKEDIIQSFNKRIGIEIF